MDLNISKAKLTKKGCLEVVYADKEGNDIVFKGINPVHPDLKDSLNKLIPYIVDITEQKESQYINWERPESCLEDEFFKKFNVTGVSIGGDSSFEVCVLTGKRTLMTSKVLNLCSPGIGFDPDNENRMCIVRSFVMLFIISCMKQSFMLQRINVRRFKGNLNLKMVRTRLTRLMKLLMQ